MALPIHWYVVPDDTPTLPFESAISNSQLDIDRNINGDLGEQYNSWKSWNWKPLPPGLFTGHYCGTRSDFANGATYDPTANYPIGALGWPRCCAPPMQVGASALYGGDVLYGRYPASPPLAEPAPIPPSSVSWEGYPYCRYSWSVPAVAVGRTCGAILVYAAPGTYRIVLLGDAAAPGSVVVGEYTMGGPMTVIPWTGAPIIITAPVIGYMIYFGVVARPGTMDLGLTIDTLP